MINSFQVYIGLGSNLGNREKYISQAIAGIEATVGTVISQSNLIETEPWGYLSDKKFLNCVILVTTSFPPKTVLKMTREIEVSLGRKEAPGGSYDDRTIDIDIIDYNGMIIKEIDIELPHPKMHLRDFVLAPLSEISPLWKHPSNNLSVDELRKQLITNQ